MPAGTKVRVSWQVLDNFPQWTEACACAIVLYGLPGDKFTTHPS